MFVHFKRTRVVPRSSVRSIAKEEKKDIYVWLGSVDCVLLANSLRLFIVIMLVCLVGFARTMDPSRVTEKEEGAPRKNENQCTDAGAKLRNAMQRGPIWPVCSTAFAVYTHFNVYN